MLRDFRVYRFLYYFMRIIMLIPMIRKNVSCNLRRIVACVTYRNKMHTKIVRQYNKTNLLSSSTSNVVAFRIYCTESDSEPHVSLPMLVTNVKPFKPSFFMPLRLFFFTLKSSQIDKEFSIFEAVYGIKYV